MYTLTLTLQHAIVSAVIGSIQKCIIVFMKIFVHMNVTTYTDSQKIYVHEE